MKIDVVTIFPDVIETVCRHSIVGRAQKKKIAGIKAHNIRNFTPSPHQSVDDYSYGGGPGMLLMAEPIFRAVESITGKGARSVRKKIRVILTSPQGELFDQQKAKELAKEKRLIIICGHYKGVDERVRESLITDEISIGDYVLTGGELPALVIIDAVVRLLPGVLNREESYKSDSFYDTLLDCPHYTRPVRFRGMTVPPVLLSGNHSEIERWRKEKALEATFFKRPDLLKNGRLSGEDGKFLRALKRKNGKGGK